MKYLLPCKCGQSVEIEPAQAGQAVSCICGENLFVPSMLQVKALPVAPDKPIPSYRKEHVPYRSALTMFFSGVVCLLLTAVLWRVERDLMFVMFRGLTVAFLVTSIALALRDWVKSPLTKDSTVRRTFFVLGVSLLFPAFFLASYLYEWQPHPRHATLKPKYFSYGSNQKMLPQDSTPIPYSEIRILWMTDEAIDRMSPMELYFYFQTLEEPTFSYNFQDNYEAVKDTYRIWVTGNTALFILAVLSIIASFFMPRQTAVVTGWSGSEWQ